MNNYRNKPILIDALHICMGGGLMILNHLVDNLVKQNINFILLRDERCPKLNSEDLVPEVKVLSASFKDRQKYYKANTDTFSKILCFGNIPPSIRLNIPVYTYQHNVSLLHIPKDYSIKSKIKTYLKKLYIKSFAKNTDAWIVQTSNTANLVRKNLAKKGQQILEYPFFQIPDGINRTSRATRTDYCFIGDHTCAKGHEYLVDAWVKLMDYGVSPVLHLTVSEPVFLPAIKDAQNNGAKIVNHGKIPFDEVVDIYNLSKAVIYPSLNESLGLGIVEGIKAGCDIIGSDLPFLHAVCKPTLIFEPCNADSIVDAVLSYEHSQYPESELIIHDSIDEFITFLNR